MLLGQKLSGVLDILLEQLRVLDYVALEYWMIVLRPIRISTPAFSQISGACCEIYDSHCVMMNHLKHSVTLQVS